MINPVETADKLERSQNAALHDLKDIKSSLEAVQPPHPWQAHFSEKYGRVYFYNPITKESLWEFPSNANDATHAPDVKRSNNGSSVSATRATSSREYGFEGDRVEDGLIQKGLAYVKRREELKRKQDLELQAEMTGKPQLSKYANALGANREVTDTIADRTAAAIRAKKEKEDELRKQQEERERNEVSGRPMITKKSQKLNRRVEDMLSWEDQRRARLEERQHAQERQQESQLTPGPAIATSKAVTEKLLKNRKNKIGEGVPIEERLQQYEEIRQYKLQKASEKADRDARLAANPTFVSNRPPASRRRSISPAGHPTQQHSNQFINSDGEDEEEEVWSDEEEYNKYIENMNRLRRFELEEQQSSKNTPKSVGFSGSTKNNYPAGHHSSTRRSREAPSAGDLAGERMHREAERALRQRNAEIQHRIAINENYGPDGKPLFQPHLNRTSVKIAEKIRGQHVPVEEILFRKGQEREEKLKVLRRQERNLLEQKARSNAPKINPTSEKIAREKEILEGRIGESRIDRLSRPIGSVKKTVLDSIERPTFAPKISKRSSQLAAQGHYYAAVKGVRSASTGRDRPSGETSGGWVSSEYCCEQSDDYDSAYNSDGAGRECSLYDRASYWARERDIKIERERHAAEQEQMRDCTFRPTLQKAPTQEGLVRGRDVSIKNGGPRDRSGSAHSGREYYDSSSDSEFRRRGGADDDYSARQISWARKRDMKLEVERKRREREEMESCSFAPNLTRHDSKESQKPKNQTESAALRSGKIPLPPHASQSWGSHNFRSIQGGFSYDTPYTGFADYLSHQEPDVAHDTEENSELTYGSATRLDFGADDDAEVGGITHASSIPQMYSSAPTIFSSGLQIQNDKNNDDEAINSPPASSYPQNGYTIAYDAEAGEYLDSDEYVVEFELDESGDVINTGSFQRYNH